ncbi:MAG TPA: SigE family RNA polymerase sigma factor [Streptosporangiaceae bacterium]|jgi:RNA polymerase sigma-70 factor (sigma-E family)
MSRNSAGRTQEVPTRGEPGHDQIAELYREHAVSLIRAAVLLVGDRASAEDVVQDAFFGLYRSWAGLRDPDKAVGYLRVAVLNGCRSVLRGRRRARLPSGLEHDPSVWSAESAVLARENVREVLAALARLPRRQREVLVLRYFLDLSEQQTADTLKVRRGTVASTRHQALASLIKDLEGKQ